MDQKKVELLVPAKNFKTIKAVAKYADAVYFGTDALNMRIKADNIPLSNIKEVVDFCHSNGMKAYLTTNVIVYENELDYLDTIMSEAKSASVDAVIVHDMAAIQIAKEKGLTFHISTQASISNSKSAQFYESIGAGRLILARECSLEMIKEIKAKISGELETFVHGAMCTAVSGRCYFSAVIYDDPICSANRGACNQPCRHKWKLVHPNGTEIDYEEGFFLNSKDLKMIEHVPELIEAGISSLKIEGRMRDPNYIVVAAQCYREAIDASLEGTFTPEKVKMWNKQLAEVYNRGFSTGFFYQRPGLDEITFESSGNQATSKKVQIGKINSYYRNIGVAKMAFFSQEIILKEGDEILIEGAGAGNFLKQTLNEMRYKNKIIMETPKFPDGEAILINFKTDQPVKKNDWVYFYR